MQNLKFKYLIIGLIVIFCVIAVCLVAIRSCDKLEKGQTQIIEREYEEPVLRRKIDGAEIDNQKQANLYPVAIMIENAADAWPLSGLDKADIVIEAITEASIPRFVAIFANDEEIEKIGPVRSARPYYLDWIDTFGPVYMHVGGAPIALQKLHSGNYGIIDLDQFFFSQYYWRDTKWRYAPHNVYTSSELIQKLLQDDDLTEPDDYKMWKYKKDKLFEERPDKVSDIEILYSSEYYKVSWEYNKEENNYLRYQHGNVMKMSDGAMIYAKNIIVQVNSMRVIDNIGRKDITTIGEGKAWIFRDGEIVEGKWLKENIKERTTYFNNNNDEIELNGGTTWIEVIPDEDYLRY